MGKSDQEALGEQRRKEVDRELLEIIGACVFLAIGLVILVATACSAQSIGR